MAQSTPQQHRIETGSMTDAQLWQKLKLPLKITNESTSKQMIRRLVAIAFSNICYLRTNFPEEAFAYNNLTKKVPIRLLQKSNCEAANAMMANAQGAMDAFKRGYLKSMEVVITDSLADDGNVLESFTFKFGKSNDVEFFETLVGKKNSEATPGTLKRFKDNEGQEKFQRAIRQTLRELLLAVESLEPLPDEAYMGMYLTYNPETPPEYEAPGYEPTNQVIKVKDALFQSSTRKLTTGYHSLQVKTASHMPANPIPAQSPERHSEPPVDAVQASGGDFSKGLDVDEDYDKVKRNGKRGLEDDGDQAGNDRHIKSDDPPLSKRPAAAKKKRQV